MGLKKGTNTVCSVLMLSLVEITDVTAMATAPPAAAASAAAGTVVGDLNDPEYVNWYKTNRALNLTIDALRPVCLSEIISFHNTLVRMHTTSPCGKSCTHKDIKSHSKWGSWSITCPNKVCCQWLPDIVRARMTKSTRLNWENSDFSQWQTQPWQLAKIFMDSGQDIASISPVGTDAAGIVQLLLNCKIFKNIMDTTKVDAVSLCSIIHNSRSLLEYCTMDVLQINVTIQTPCHIDHT